MDVHFMKNSFYCRLKPRIHPFRSANHHLRPKLHLPRSTSIVSLWKQESNFRDSPSRPLFKSDSESLKRSSYNLGDGYMALFVQMLGLDKDHIDREQAIIALWEYSLGGEQCVENIMQFHGCLNLTVNLLKSKSNSARQAAAGLLRSVSSVNSYRGSVVESGAIEGITALLSSSSLTAEIKEESIYVLWNLSADERFRKKIGNAELLQLFIKCLDDDELRVKEAVAGVMANLALSKENHSTLVEFGAIPKLVKLLNLNVEGSKVVRKEARNALLKLAKDEYYRIIVTEEGYVLVPLVGAAAYESFRPVSHSWPSLPDGTEFQRTSKAPSKYGAAELLLGLNIDDNDLSIEEIKMNSIVGRTRQQFLARIGAIEKESGRNSENESSNRQQFILLPWMDGVARLVLILELEDDSAISKAAHSIADASINEHMRILFKEAGAIKHLVRLLHHNNNAIKLAATCALEKLSISNYVCQVIKSEGAIHPLISTLKNSEVSEILTEKVLNVLARILDPGKEMKSKFYYGSVNGDEMSRELDVMTIAVSNSRSDVLDLVFASRLVEILKNSSPKFQMKAASILEFLTIFEPSLETLISADLKSGLDAVFDHQILKDMETEGYGQNPALYEVEEASNVISTASRLLTKLLDMKEFRESIDLVRVAALLRRILTSEISLGSKEWVAASLVKLNTFINSNPGDESEKDLNMEVVTLHEKIPRLIEKMSGLDAEEREGAVIELKNIISKGTMDSTQSIGAKGGIFPLVKVLEVGNEAAVEAGLAILYNLSMDDENHPAIIAAGTVPVLKRYVNAQRPHWMQALRLLWSLPTLPDAAKLL